MVNKISLKQRFFYKKFYLLLIVVITLILVVYRLDAYDFGFIAIVCWILSFLDISRIKFKDYEINFMTEKQTLRADEKKIFLDNLNLLRSFSSSYLQKGYVDKEAIDYIEKAYSEAQFYLPEKFSKYIKPYYDKAKEAFEIHYLLENIPIGPQRTELSKKQTELIKYFLTMEPTDLYREYLRVKVGEEE